MSIIDRIKKREEERKKLQAEKQGKLYTPPTWPEGYPKLLEIKPRPPAGVIEERVIYRTVLNSNSKQKHWSCYVSQDSIYCAFETTEKNNNWNVLSFEDYRQEYIEMHEVVKKKGKLTGRIKFSELVMFDEITITVPINSIMELKPSPEEIDIGHEAFIAELESDFEKKSNDDDDFLNAAEYENKNPQ